MKVGYITYKLVFLSTLAIIYFSEVLTALIEQQKAERAVFRSKIEDIQVNLATPACSDASGTILFNSYRIEQGTINKSLI